MKADSRVRTASAIASLLFACTLLASGSVLGQGLRGFYVYGAMGQSTADVNKTNLDSALRVAGATGISSEIDDNDTGYKLQVGYMFNQYFGVEGGWVDLGKFGYNATFTGGLANANLKASGLNVSGIGELPLSDRFSLYARLGIIGAKAETDVSASGPGAAANGSASDTSVKPNFGLGMSLSLARNWAVRAEWERFSKLGDKGNTGETDVDLWSIGIKYSF